MADDNGVNVVTTPQAAATLIFDLAIEYYYRHGRIPTLDDIRLNGQPISINLYRTVAMLYPYYTPNIRPLGFFRKPNGRFGIEFDNGLKQKFSQVLGEIPDVRPFPSRQLRTHLTDVISKELLASPTTFFHDVPAKKGYKPIKIGGEEGKLLNLESPFPGGAEYLKDYPKAKSDFERHNQKLTDLTEEEQYNAEMSKLGGGKVPEALIEMGKRIAARKARADMEIKTDYRKPPPPPPPPGSAGDGSDIKPKGYRRLYKK